MGCSNIHNKVSIRKYGSKDRRGLCNRLSSFVNPILSPMTHICEVTMGTVGDTTKSVAGNTLAFEIHLSE